MQIRPFTGGDPAARAHLNQLVDAVNKQQTLRGDSVIRVNQGPTGRTVGLNVEALLPRIPKPPSGLRAVLVWQDGGTTDGDATHECDRTYTARTLDATGPAAGGTELGTELVPKKRRWVTNHYGAYSCPADAGDGVVGLGYYDNNHAFCLYDANETPDTSVCP